MAHVGNRESGHDLRAATAAIRRSGQGGSRRSEAAGNAKGRCGGEAGSLLGCGGAGISLDSDRAAGGGESQPGRARGYTGDVAGGGRDPGCHRLGVGLVLYLRPAAAGAVRRRRGPDN